MSDENMPSIDLVPSDIVGAVQRMGHELNAYLSQHVSRIDPNVAMAYLERMASFVRALPVPHVSNGATSPEAGEARPN